MTTDTTKAAVEAAQDMHDYGTCLADQKYHRRLAAALATPKGGVA